MPSLSGASHRALTVRDMDAGARWYQRVPGLPDDRTSDAFDHRRTGLDHLAFRVADEAELDAWIAHLDELGVPHSPVRVLDLGRFVSFEDPDGIQFELWL